MSRQLDQVSRAAMSLTADERAELAERIWESVTAEEDASLECGGLTPLFNVRSIGMGRPNRSETATNEADLPLPESAVP